MKFELNFLKPDFSTNSDRYIKRSFFSVFLGILLVLLISYLIYIPPKQSIEDPGIKTGDIVKNDIVIQKDLTIIDEDSTLQKKNEAIEQIIPIYEYHKGFMEKRAELFNSWINFIRSSRKKYYKEKNELKPIKENIEKKFGISLSFDEVKYLFKTNIFGRINNIKLYNTLNRFYDTGILSSKAGSVKSINGTIKILGKNKQPGIEKVSDLSDLKDVENGIRIFFTETGKFRSGEVKVLTSLLMEFIDINLSFSLNLTKDEEQLTISKINPVIIKFKTGRIILRKGDEVKPDDLKIINLIATTEKVTGKKFSYFYFIFFILTILLFFLGRLLRSWENIGINGKKLITVSIATLLLSAFIYRIFLFILPLVLKNLSFSFNIENHIIFFAIPFAFGPLIIAFIFNIQSAVIFSFINSVIGGIISDWDLMVFLYILIGGLIVSYGIEYYQRLKRSPILKVGIIWLLPANLIFLLMFSITMNKTDPVQIFSFLSVGAFSAVSAPILASFIIPLWEIVFKPITELKLVELTNLNLPIFREMLEKAPGTYHHSQMVSSLSEAAALDLGLSSLLLNAMALYHDIGKIDNPQVFTENHAIYENPHENLTPKESARNIIAHINNGLERAKEIKLSDRIASSISQHHGTKLVRFFYDKAVESASVDASEIDENLYKYPGEKPENIENAIIMLADQVEAASKSLSSPSDEEIKNIIQRIIDSNIEEKQFDQCDGLTLKALNTIGNAFYKKLSSIYHMRISYPGFNFQENGENAENS
ncbi:MAG: HDIG domain-containing metalloprotein [Acidobacteriota bacterium]